MKPGQAPTSGLQFDPRVTMIALAVLSITTVATDRWFVLAGIAALLTLYKFATGLPASAILKSTAAVAWFAAAALAVSALTIPGEVLYKTGEIYVTKEGVATGLALSARLVLLVWISTAYVLTIPLVRTMDGIASLLRPLSRGRGTLPVVSGIAVAFIPMLIQIAKRVRAARIARGEPEGRGFVANARFAASAAVPLFACVFRSADELAEAMEARCFDPASPRSRYADLRVARRDWVMIGVMAAWAAASLSIMLRFA